MANFIGSLFQGLFNSNGKMADTTAMGTDTKTFSEEDGTQAQINMTENIYFATGNLYPPAQHRERIDRYKRNRKIFKGEHFDVFKSYTGAKQNKDLLYISVNLAGLICKKSADFLFGESVQVNAGDGGSSPEQDMFTRLVDSNDFNILTYESALGNAYRGDSFFKIRYGSVMGGELPKEIDPPRVIIEHQNPEHVFPETSLFDKNKIVAYHVAVPAEVQLATGEAGFQLFVESHYCGRIEYRVYNITVLESKFYGGYMEVLSYKIQDEVIEGRSIVLTGISTPLIVHIPNFGTDDEWNGLDDLSEHMSIFDEVNNRLSQIADILDKHSDPAMAVPSGILSDDENGNPTFHIQRDKVFEVMGKEDIIPSYITWDGQLASAFTELDKLVDLLLTTAEIPAVAVGKGDSGGMSGTSGIAIKWRMNSLLSKINRKKQYYTRGIKQVFSVAQLLETAVGISDYKLTVPQLTFQDGLPKDEASDATIANIRTGGAKTLSQQTAIMRMEGMNEEQALAEMDKIKAEEEANMPPPVEDPSMLGAVPTTDTSKHSTETPVTDSANKNPAINGSKKAE